MNDCFIIVDLSLKIVAGHGCYSEKHKLVAAIGYRGLNILKHIFKTYKFIEENVHKDAVGVAISTRGRKKGGDEGCRLFQREF